MISLKVIYIQVIKLHTSSSVVLLFVEDLSIRVSFCQTTLKVLFMITYKQSNIRGPVSMLTSMGNFIKH